MKGPKTCIWALALLLAMSILFMNSCSDKPEGPDNLAPEKPSNPTPANLSGGIGQVGLELQWECSDPDDDSIFYDVYLGTDGNPPKVASDITENYYYSDYLQPEEDYYWRVVARDSDGNESISPIWTFTTRNPFEFIYPIEIGYQWEYTSQVEFFNFDPPEIESMIIPIPGAYSRVEINDLVEDDLTPMYQFYQYVDQEGDIYEQNSYYSNQSHGLLYFGSDNAGAGILDTPAPIRNPKIFVFNGRRFNSISEILAELGTGTPAGFSNIELAYADPLLVLYYPLEVGSVWNYRGDQGDLIWIDKKVIGTEEIEVPAGSFECFKIQWFYDMDKDGHWDEGATVMDYVCAAGLVKRVSILEDIDVIAYDNPTPIGTMDMRETLELTGFSLRKTE
jgi:hypothetical protein